MATPTPMRHGASQQGRTPSQQGRTPSQMTGATPPVSTPFSSAAHAAFSPYGTRTSPQQVKKSPANSATLMGQPSTGTLNFDSPSTAAAMRALDMGSGFDLGLDNMGVGGLDGLGAFSGDDDKVKRLDTILKTLDKKGLVSEAGLARLAQRLGLELLSDEQTAADGRKTKTLILAGSAMALDIVLDNNIVQSISLAFHEAPPSVARHTAAASQILLNDLKLRPNQSPLTKTLDAFATNFERLTTLDKLSISPGLDCQEALAGIFISLERLYNWDIAKLKGDATLSGKSDAYLSQLAMCAEHGVPVMHARGRVGLAIQYWKELRFFPPESERLKGFSEKNEKTWSLLISCAPIEEMGLPLPPVRVSENWISKDISKEVPDLEPKPQMLDWQEPDNVTLPQNDDNKEAGMDVLQPDLSMARVPRVTFTMALDPPVILPQTDWMRLYSYANIEPPPMSNPNDFTQRGVPAVPPTFDSLFFPISAGAKQEPSAPRRVSCDREVRIFGEDHSPVTKTHRNTLFIYKPVYSQVATEMPFSHPRQLVEMLPLLRQYAFLSTLLENSFSPVTRNGQADEKQVQDGEGKTKPVDKTTAEELASFMGSNGTHENKGNNQTQDRKSTSQDLNLDVILWVHPMPHIQIVFPLRDSTANITIQILENGVVAVTNENVLSAENDAETKGKGRNLTREQLGKVLEHLEDLGKWAEWIRARF